MEDICHGCGEKFDDCICEELDENANEGKYPDDDPLDGDYKINGSAPVTELVYGSGLTEAPLLRR